MRVAVVINRGAGTVLRRQGLDASELRRMFARAGVEAEIAMVDGEEIQEVARAAVARGAAAVLAGGGDGTIRAVAGVLAGGTVPLGVLPLGTRNHFARDLGIPTELAAAVELAASGQVRRLDLGEVNGEVFVNNSMLGFYPPVVRIRDWQRRRRSRGKGLATTVALLRILPDLPALRVCIEAPGDETAHATAHETWFVFVGNNRYEMSLFSYGARERFDSGSLHLYVAKPRSRLGLVGLALLGVVRDVTRTAHFESWTLPELTIETHKTALPVYCDGEVMVMRPPLHYRTRERDLPVIVP